MALVSFLVDLFQDPTFSLIAISGAFVIGLVQGIILGRAILVRFPRLQNNVKKVSISLFIIFFANAILSVPHFYHTPFYCYAYSFGNLLALSLFQRYKKEGNDFAPSYISILSAGGSQKPETLLNEYGLDIRSPKFWQGGFDFIKTQVKELEAIN